MRMRFVAFEPISYKKKILTTWMHFRLIFAVEFLNFLRRF